MQVNGWKGSENITESIEMRLSDSICLDKLEKNKEVKEWPWPLRLRELQMSNGLNTKNLQAWQWTKMYDTYPSNTHSVPTGGPWMNRSEWIEEYFEEKEPSLKNPKV